MHNVTRTGRRTADRVQKMGTAEARKRFLNTCAALGFAAVALIAGSAQAQVAGSQTIGVSQEEMKMVALGWSAKRDLLGKAVYNDSKQKIGSVDDIIITPEKWVSFAIVGVGGFLGIGKHDVAIPMDHLKQDQDRWMLPGATKDTLKALPKFEYAKRDKSARTDTKTDRSRTESKTEKK